jgi:ankyrin repeat protein
MKRTLLTLKIASLLATTAFADPIHVAAAASDLAAIRAELDKGAAVNAKDKVGHTPVDSAERENYLRSPEVQKEITNLLRKHSGKTGGELKAEGK